MTIYNCHLYTMENLYRVHQLTTLSKYTLVQKYYTSFMLVFLLPILYSNHSSVQISYKSATSAKINAHHIALWLKFPTANTIHYITITTVA